MRVAAGAAPGYERRVNSLVAEMFRAWQQGEAEPAPITRWFGMRPVSFGEGTASLEMTTTENHLNPMAIIHGSVFVALADSAMGCALATVIEPGETFSTVSLTSSYFKALEPGTRMVAAATVLRRGRTTAYVECDIRVAEQLVAKLASTCVIRATG